MVAGLGVEDELRVQQLGDFEIVKPIGCGAMGIVYLANRIHWCLLLGFAQK